MRTPWGWLRLGPIVVGLPLIILALGCAKSVYPPGGPVDKIPAKIISSIPATGSTSAPLDSQIVINLSKPLDDQTVAKALFISPSLDADPKIKIKGRSIIVIPKKPLAADKTYVVTLGSDIRDMHGVSLAQSASIAFSTGSTIDSGAVHGTVYKEGKPAAGVSLALLEMAPEKYAFPLDSVAPDYLTQTGQDGSFSFQYLPDREFFLIAFEDKNKNRHINPAREMVGLPFMPLHLSPTERLLRGVDIRLQMTDSSALGLRSVTVNADRLLKIRFDKGLDSVAAAQLFKTARISPEKDSTVNIPIADYTNFSANPSADFVAVVPALDTGKNYRMVLDISSLYPSVPDSLKSLSSAFTFPDMKDVNRPVLLEKCPIDKALNLSPDTSFVLRFSEPIDSTKLVDATRIAGPDGDTTGVQIHSRGLFTWIVKAQQMLKYGHAYKILFDDRLVMDLAGNSLADSTETISFSTMGKDTLGQLSGEIVFAIPSDTVFPVIVAATPARDGAKREVNVPPGRKTFSLDLFPGYYVLSAFLDRNQNGRYDYGTILPYRLAEPFCAPVDTFRVRTRFESTGAVLKF